MILRNNNNNVPGWDGMGAGKAGQMRIKGRTLGSVLFRLIFQRRVDVRIETGIVLAIKAMRQKAFIDYFSAQFSIQFNWSISCCCCCCCYLHFKSNCSSSNGHRFWLLKFRNELNWQSFSCIIIDPSLWLSFYWKIKTNQRCSYRVAVCSCIALVSSMPRGSMMALINQSMSGGGDAG